MIHDLLVNGFFLLLFCCFVPLVLIFKDGTIDRRKSILTIAASAAIIACISYPIRMETGVIFDLRLVAQIFGSIYGGPFVAGVLMLVNVGYRSIFDGVGVITSFIIAPLHFILLIALRQWFIRLPIKWKVLNSVLVGIASALLTVFIIAMFGVDIPIKLIIYFTVIQSLVLGIIIYTVETIEKLWLSMKKLYQYEKMETISQLTSSISHEIRNPLTSVKGFLQLLQQTKLEERQKNYIEISLSELSHAEKVIEDYLAFAKPYENEAIEVLDIKQEIDDVLRVMKPLANKSSIQLKVKVDHYEINANKQYFRQCLVNICKNAIEAMVPNAQGTISIETSIESNHMLISFIDTGIGMTKEQLSRIGEPYYSTKGRSGTGLGTMFVYHYIREIGGDIQVTSQKGIGTKFTIKLPFINRDSIPLV